MARMVVLGHGGFEKKDGEYLVPPNTTVTFLADAGSPLLLPSVYIGEPGKQNQVPREEGANWRFNYEKVADLLPKYLETQSPLTPGKVTYNMSAAKVGDESFRVASELAAQGKLGDRVMLTSSSTDWYLCTGDDTTCPTPKLHVAQSRHEELEAMGSEAKAAFEAWLNAGGVGPMLEVLGEFDKRIVDVPEHMRSYVVTGVPEERWHHNCDGILGKTVGEGHDIVWLSCSGFVADQDDLDDLGLSEGLPEEITRGTHGPGADWFPDDAALDRVNALNEQKLRDLPAGESIKIRVGTPLMLVGDGHEGDVENFVKRQADFQEGTLTVKKTVFGSKGPFEVKGIPDNGQRELVTTILKSINDKEISFG